MRRLAVGLSMLATAAGVAAATPPLPGPLAAEIAAADKAMFDAFNACDLDGYFAFWDDSFEFYDDRSGLNKSRDVEVASFKDRCPGGKPRLTRELVAGALTVEPLGAFGAMETADHIFYEIGADGAKTLAGKGRMIVLWKRTEGGWKVSRVVSYEHRPTS